MLKQEILLSPPSQPSPQYDVPPQRPSARSPPQQPCPVSRVATVKERTVEPPAEDEIPLGVRVCMEERIDDRMKPERIALESSSADTGPAAPGQDDLLNWEIQQPIAMAVHSSTAVRVWGKSPNQTSLFFASCKIVFLQMTWKPQDMVIMSNEENKHFDPGG